MRAVLALSAFLAAAASASAEVQIRVTNGRVDLQAAQAPLSEVLDRLAKQTGMKVTYDGPPQRMAVNLTLKDRTPAQAVLGVLDGLGLNYALRMDLTGTRVETLLIAGSAATTTGGPAAPTPQTGAFRPPGIPAQVEEDTASADEDATDADTPVDADTPQAPGGQPGAEPIPNVPNAPPADATSRPFGQGMMGTPPAFPSPIAPPFLGSRPAPGPQTPPNTDDSTQQ